MIGFCQLPIIEKAGSKNILSQLFPIVKVEILYTSNYLASLIIPMPSFCKFRRAGLP